MDDTTVQKDNIEEEVELSKEIASSITVHAKYAKFDPKKQRRETWTEICYRNRDMHLKKYPYLYQQILDVYTNFIIPKKVLPSMRSMQFAGKPIEVSPNRIYNCGFLPVEHYKSFSETMFLLLGGTGIGYSVQKQHVDNLPEIRKPRRTRRFLIEDSITGWADAVKVLMEAYFKGKSLPVFDFSDIRPKGANLITSGGKAPGADPLKVCLFNLQLILDKKNDGDKITTLEAHDMMCFIADAVLSGGIRRAALISLFDIDDEAMLTCKFGSWWEQNPQRGRSNNSAVIVRHKITKDKFMEVWEKIKASGSGEPGIYLTNNPEWGTNPCVEIALRPFQFCNLTEINGSDILSQEDLEERAKAAAFIGTLQAGYTDFHYLRDIWKRTTEKDALIGVGMTGIASGAVLPLDLKKASQVVKDENERVAKLININPAARTTCVKPSGTTSLVVGSSSGIHAWHSEYYIRNIRFGKNEAIYSYLAQNHPEIVQDEFFKPTEQAVVGIPVKAPSKAIFRNESAIQLLERVKKFSNEWVKPGHRKGDNTHNVSATISVGNTEWEDVGEWMWNNRDVYNGLSVLPRNDHTYLQPPFEECTKERYEELYAKLKMIDLTKVVEDQDNTSLTDQQACAGGNCEV
jgi:ribonucleoside-triphosphate reductase